MQLRLFWAELEGRVQHQLVVTRATDAMFVLSMTCLEDHVSRAQTVFDGVVASFRLPSAIRE